MLQKYSDNVIELKKKKNFKYLGSSKLILKNWIFFSNYDLDNSRYTTMKNIDLGDITVHNLKQLKKINQIVFPVSYNDKFYKDILEIGPLAKLGSLPLLILSKE